MSDAKSYVEVSGMIIGSGPIGEYDRRVVLLTRQMGKISAFAKGARRPNSTLVAATGLFCYGKFRLFAGKNAYTLVDADISNYFPYFRTHVEDAMYGTYFLEVMEYITRENNDESTLLLLTYASLCALEASKIDRKLIRSIFEIKTVVLEGEFEEPNYESYSQAAGAALRHIAQAKISSLYTFTVDDAAQKELALLADKYMRRSFGHHFASLDVINTMNL